MIHSIKLNKTINYTGLGGQVEGVLFVKDLTTDGLGTQEILDIGFIQGCGIPAQQWGCNGFASIAESVAILPADPGDFSNLLAQNWAYSLVAGDTVRIGVDIRSLDGSSDVQVFPSNNNNGATFTQLGYTEQDVLIDAGLTEFGVYNISGTGAQEARINSISIRKVLLPNEIGGILATSIVHAAGQTFPSDLIAYDVTWDADPILGDKISLLLDDINSYEDSSFTPAVPLEGVTVLASNCADNIYIVTQPQDTTLVEYELLTLSVTATNAQFYQWYVNNTLIDGAINSIYNLEETIIGVFNYYCKISNSELMVTTNTAIVTVTEKSSTSAVAGWVGTENCT